jgi:hypothetical protein
MAAAVDALANEVSATTDINPVAATTLLIPALRARSAETDALGRLPDSTVADPRGRGPVRHADPEAVRWPAMLTENIHGCRGGAWARGWFDGLGR